TTPDVCASSETGPAHKPLRTVGHDRVASRSERRVAAPTVQVPPPAPVAAERVAPPPSAEKTTEPRARLARPTRPRLRCRARDERSRDSYAHPHLRTTMSRSPARSPRPERWHSSPLLLDTFVVRCGHAGR